MVIVVSTFTVVTIGGGPCFKEAAIMPGGINHARRLLQEMAAAGGPLPGGRAEYPWPLIPLTVPTR
eukprot:859505-Pelagomonas_calceolata.AAC.4